MTKIIVVILAGLCCFCCCAWFATSLTQTGLERDVAQVFQTRAEVEVAPTCRMIEERSTGLCYFSGSVETTASLADGLSLQEVVPTDEAVWDFFLDIELTQEGCRSDTRFSDLSVTRIYSSKTWRPPELQLEGRDVFEHVILYHNTVSNEVCLQVMIAYG